MTKLAEVRCKQCKKLFFKARYCDLEIMCKCGYLNVIKFETASAILLTSPEPSNIIESYKRKEVIEPGRKVSLRKD